MKTSKQQILPLGGDESTCSLVVSPVSPSAWLDEEKERKMTATSGRKCFGQYGRYDPLGLLVKTLLESSRWYNPAVRLKWNIKPLCSKRVERKQYPSLNTSSRPSAATLSVKDIPSSRLLFRLAPSALRTAATGYSLLPTVQTQGLKRCNAEGKTEFLPLGLLPTPLSTEVRHGKRVKELKEAGGETPHSRANGETRPNGLMDFMDFHGMLLTPSASDAVRANFSMDSLRNHSKPNAERSNLSEQIAHKIGGGTSQLNPLFVEEMMGFPSMWSVLPFL